MRKQLSLKAAAQAGFTLIELIIVIVIIGILAAVAIPKYLSLTDDANVSVANAYTGAFASAAASNFAICSGSTSATGCKSGAAGAGKIACTVADAQALVDGMSGTLGVDATANTISSCKLTVNGKSATTAAVIKSL